MNFINLEIIATKWCWLVKKENQELQRIKELLSTLGHSRLHISSPRPVSSTSDLAMFLTSTLCALWPSVQTCKNDQCSSGQWSYANDTMITSKFATRECIPMQIRKWIIVKVAMKWLHMQLCMTLSMLWLDGVFTQGRIY